MMMMIHTRDLWLAASLPNYCCNHQKKKGEEEKELDSLVVLTKAINCCVKSHAKLQHCIDNTTYGPRLATSLSWLFFFDFDFAPSRPSTHHQRFNEAAILRYSQFDIQSTIVKEKKMNFFFINFFRLNNQLEKCKKKKI